MFHKTKFQRPA